VAETVHEESDKQIIQWRKQITSRETKLGPQLSNILCDMPKRTISQEKEEYEEQQEEEGR
jgi:hypothetical protein